MPCLKGKAARADSWQVQTNPIEKSFEFSNFCVYILARLVLNVVLLLLLEEGCCVVPYGQLCCTYCAVCIAIFTALLLLC
eukprot:m.165510 g.165510  ORF g.165510 m.165510 type:complete len:80 (+) comp18138_c0_seq10:2820-3059(+)